MRGDVRANDRDAETPADALVVTGVWAGGGTGGMVGRIGAALQGAYGWLTLDADGGYSYVAGTNADGPVDDVFTYRIADADGGVDMARLTIRVNGVADALPPQTPDFLVTHEENYSGPSLRENVGIQRQSDEIYAKFQISIPRPLLQPGYLKGGELDPAYLTVTNSHSRPDSRFMLKSGADPKEGETHHHFLLTSRRTSPSILSGTLDKTTSKKPTGKIALTITFTDRNGKTAYA